MQVLEDKYIEKEIKKLHRRVNGLQHKFQTIYQRTYANTIRRRSSSLKKAEYHKRRWDDLMTGYGAELSRMSRIMKRMRRGRIIVTLSRPQYNKLMIWLGNDCRTHPARW